MGGRSLERGLAPEIQGGHGDFLSLSLSVAYIEEIVEGRGGEDGKGGSPSLECPRYNELADESQAY